MPPQSNDIRLQLVGGILVNTDDPHYRWFGETYSRITSEVQHTGEVARIVRYESRSDAQGHVLFFGIEVERIADIPEGMVAWELRDDVWTMWLPTGDIAWQTAVTWLWRELVATEHGRWCGEFTAPCPPAWCGDAVTAFEMTAQAYLTPRNLCYDDEIALADPDPTWPEQYEECAAWLHETLGPDVALRIEHYGSTSIPGIPAKPVIDVLVEIPSYPLARQRALTRLHGEEWEFWRYHDHLVFTKRQEIMGRRTHHIHLAPAGDPLWQGIAFRDYLRAHPDDAARYAELKQELSIRYREDREGYTEAKTAFVLEITAKALQDTLGARSS